MGSAADAGEPNAGIDDRPEIQMKRPSYSRRDFAHSPLIVFYEVTQACDLLCAHCRASAQPYCHPDELTTQQSRQLIGALAGFAIPPMLVLTGGDPLKRPDIFELVDEAVRQGLEVSMTPSATPLVTAQAVRRLKDAGVSRLAVSLDGGDAETHDRFRGVRGSFEHTIQIVSDARACGLPVQINTTIARHNIHQLEAIAELLDGMGIVLWSVFFLVPTGRAQADQRLGADESEQAFERLWQQSQRRSFAIKTTEAPHYRRFILQRAKENGRSHNPGTAGQPGGAAAARPVPMAGTNDGKGVMFVSHTGLIYPSGFLPVRSGRFPQDSPVDVYRQSPLFQALRDPDRLGGKCGACEYREICGGSRARSYALAGDPLAAEPDCAFIPARYQP
jgi:AdoMet-dependent heme synthase